MRSVKSREKRESGGSERILSEKENQSQEEKKCEKGQERVKSKFGADKFMSSFKERLLLL